MASPITLNSSAFLMLQQLELVTDSDGAQHGQPLDSWCLESHSREMCKCVCVRECVSLLYTLLMPCLLAISLSSEIACTSPTATATAAATVAAALSATCLPQVDKLLLLLRFMANAHRSTLRTVFHGHHHPQHAAQLRGSLHFAAFLLIFLFSICCCCCGHNNALQWKS